MQELALQGCQPRSLHGRKLRDTSATSKGHNGDDMANSQTHLQNGTISRQDYHPYPRSAHTVRALQSDVLRLQDAVSYVRNNARGE